jgi:hypothetical protein
MWFGALALAAALVAIGLRLPRPAANAGRSPRPAPGPWRLRLFGFFSTVGFFALQWVGPSAIPFASLTVLLIALLDGAVAWIVARWAGRQGWGTKHRLALAVGAASFFLLLAPLLEAHPPAGRATTGMTVVALCWLLFFVIVSRRLGRVAPTASITPTSPERRVAVESTEATRST